MNKLALCVVLALFAALPAAVRAASCEAQAAEKKLAGAAKASFVKKCTTDAVTQCDAQATEKKLSGAAKTSFTQKCAADTAGPEAACDVQATGKNLYGAARTSFTKKCVADAASAPQ